MHIYNISIHENLQNETYPVYWYLGPVQMIQPLIDDPVIVFSLTVMSCHATVLLIICDIITNRCICNDVYKHIWKVEM